MNTIILEGIATSGKSSLSKQLRSILNGKLKIKIASEDETHEPIMEKKESLHTDFYLEQVNRFVAEYPDVLIIDRFYLTQAFRSKASLKQYENVEKALRPYNPVTIFLRVEPSAIVNRIDKAVQHRGEEWANYVASRGRSREEQSAYYIAQQKTLLNLLKESTLPYRIFDSTTGNYEAIAEKIIIYLGLDSV